MENTAEKPAETTSPLHNRRPLPLRRYSRFRDVLQALANCLGIFTTTFPTLSDVLSLTLTTAKLTAPFQSLSIYIQIAIFKFHSSQAADSPLILQDLLHIKPSSPEAHKYIRIYPKYLRYPWHSWAKVDIVLKQTSAGLSLTMCLANSLQTQTHSDGRRTVGVTLATRRPGYLWVGSAGLFGRKNWYYPAAAQC